MATGEEAIKVIETALAWAERRRGAKVPFTNDPGAIAVPNDPDCCVY